jgi:septal ring factor EnvC (AmiA/AmiB activator)
VAVNVQSGGFWTHSFTPSIGGYTITVTPFSDEEALRIYKESGQIYESVMTGFSVAKSILTPTPTSTSTLTPTIPPTPNYSATIAAVETKISEQNESIATIETRIAEQGATIAIHDTMIAEIKAVTPNETPNYSATIATIQIQQVQIVEKQGWLEQQINRILSFLGLV